MTKFSTEYHLKQYGDYLLYSTFKHE